MDSAVLDRNEYSDSSCSDFWGVGGVLAGLIYPRLDLKV